MKSIRYLFLLGLLHSSVSLRAASLDGTASVQYEAATYAFANGDFARGFVRLNDGFSVPAGGTVTLNMVVPAAGAVNLNSTGIILLEGDLTLASNASLTTGGVVDGQGNAVIMQGNLELPAGETLECASDTIIDGQGHELVLAQGLTTNGRLFINGPAGTRVTLRNMSLRGVRDVNGLPAIHFGTNIDQVLVLENVTLHLSDDLTFAGGGIEIQGQTMITGLYKPLVKPKLVQLEFNYLSADNIVINSDSQLLIDTTVKFSYMPSDNSNEHFKLIDSSSRLFLNGSTFFVPQDTGLILKIGHLLIDHKTILQGNGAQASTRPVQFGMGLAKCDLAVDILPSAQLIVDDTVLRYKNQA